MLSMLVMVTMASAFITLAIVEDCKQMKTEHKHNEEELNHCNAIIHGYNGRG